MRSKLLKLLSSSLRRTTNKNGSYTCILLPDTYTCTQPVN